MPKNDHLPVSVTDITIPRPFRSFQDAPSLIFYAEHIFHVSGLTSLSDVLLLLAAQSIYLTQEEIALFFTGEERSVRRALKRLIDHKENGKKRPYLEKGRFPEKEGQSFYYYMVTKAGYEEASRMMDGRLRLNYKESHKKRTLVHSYASGMNAVSLFLTGTPFYAEREVYAAGQRYDEKNPLRIDHVLHADGNGFSGTIYVEEDTGAENRDVLLQKVADYSRLGYMRFKDDVLYFSFYQPHTSVSRYFLSYDGRSLRGLTFSEEKLLSFAGLMEEYGCRDDAIGALSLIEDEAERAYCRVFLLSVGGLMVGEDGRDTPGPLAVTPDFIRAYIALSRRLVNPYVISGINAVHLSLAHTNLEVLARAFMSLHNAPGTDFLSDIRMGFRVLCGATPLSSDVFTLLSMRQQENIGLYGGLLEDICGHQVAFREDSQVVYTDETYSIVLRNIFQDAEGIVFAVEPVCFDAGAWYRLWCLLALEPAFPWAVLCLFDDEKQAERFFRMMGNYSRGYEAWDMDRAIDGPEKAGQPEGRADTGRSSGQPDAQDKKKSVAELQRAAGGLYGILRGEAGHGARPFIPVYDLLYDRYDFRKM